MRISTRALLALASVLFTLSEGACASSGPPAEEAESAIVAASLPAHVRYLAINVGNVTSACGAYEYKLCEHDTSARIRDYITEWRPDVVLVSELLDEAQLDRVLHDSDVHFMGSADSDLGGPVLPPELGYDHVCHGNVDRLDGSTHLLFPLDLPSGSHRHECVAWRRDRLALVSEAHVLGPDSPDLSPRCNYDFTMQAATLRLLRTGDELTGIATHPDSTNATCRTDTIARMWREFGDRPRVFVGGDWNTADEHELSVPPSFRINYSKGVHFTVAHEGEYTASYLVRGHLTLDHTFSNFGRPCTICGVDYGGESRNLAFGSALGGFDGQPMAAIPGVDHHQILVDLFVE
jgi:hypothetical protein